MIEWIDLRRLGSERDMNDKYLATIVCVALVCMTGLTALALYLGINGTVLSTVIGIFGVIIGAIAMSIHDKRLVSGKK